MSFSLSETPRTIAIIGGGVSGALVAANLLRRARDPLRVIVIERGTTVGRGVAYASPFPEHLLNVPADRMGLWAEDPGHFVSWLRAHQGEPGIPERIDTDAYLPRALYGAYVERVLDEVRANAPDAVSYERIHGEVCDVDERDAGGARLSLIDGRTIDADEVVLALGNLPGEYPIPRPLPFYHSPRYVHVPWRPDALDGLQPDDDVLLVGQGLTATDLIVQLERRGHRGTIHAVSRHGIQPRSHEAVAPYPSFLAVEPIPTNIRHLVRRVRQECRRATQQGSDWRAVIDGMRPYMQAIWQALPGPERARFLRHVRPLWEVHRHRIAPGEAATVDRLVATGRLKYHAGRLQALENEEDGAHVLLRRRGTIQHVSLRVAKVINCSGPRTDYSKYQHPLLVHLLARGLIDHDPFALGINALPTGEVLRYRGGPIGWLYTLGAPLKGILWESTAVAEIRQQAKLLAEKLLTARAPVALV